MTPLQELRHSTAHVMATAVLRLFPDAKLDIGPPTDSGFYYDFDLEHRLTPEDLEKIEAEMKRVIEENQRFQRFELSRDEAKDLLNQKDQPYKIERLGDIPEDEAISFYQNGEFVDLCAGTHVDSTGKIPAFKLLNVAGAYYRGDENNKQLQRVYGTAFFSQKELKRFLHQREEAAKRDHRKLGHELRLFRIEPMVGTGLPIMLPRGGTMRAELERLIGEKLAEYDYERVYTPHIGSIELYKTSGHFPFYAHSMYEPINIEEKQFLLKPMNCPMHIQVYASEPRSYRDLPQRYAEFGTVYRHEQSGELNGLVRVRGFTQDDGHIFCTPEQLKEEFKKCLKMVQEVMGLFEIRTQCRVSLRDPDDKDKYVGEDSLWQPAEQCIEEVVNELELDHTIGHGEAAFYGPKLDFMALDVLGRKWQIGTIQVDFSLPQRFELEYTGSDGKAHRPVMVHRAIFGSIERYMGLLIEHFNGSFPVWLAPEQIRLLPISEDQLPYADEIAARCKEMSLRAHVDRHDEKIGAKIRRARLDRIPYLAVVGKKEVENGTIALRSRQYGEEGSYAVGEFLDRVSQEVQARTLTSKPEGLAETEWT